MIKIDLSQILVDANDVAILDESAKARTLGFHLSNTLGYARLDALKSVAIAKKIAEGEGKFEVDEADAAKLIELCNSGVMINFCAAAIINQINKAIREKETSDGKTDGGNT